MADEICLQPIDVGTDNIVANEEFLAILKANYLNQVVKENDRISITYFNKLFKFEIMSIKSYDPADFLEQLQDLSIDYKYFFIRRLTRFTTVRAGDDAEYTTAPAEEVTTRIGGLDEQLKEILELIDVVFDWGVKTTTRKVQSILLHGNSGCGKTLLCNEIARKYGHVMRIDVNANEIFTKFYGESEGNLKRLFEKAFTNYPNPTLLVIEDVNNLCPKGDNSDATKRVASYFLSLLDRVALSPEGGRIMVLATTTNVDTLNPACRRSGRLDFEIEVPVPNVRQRLDILKVLLENVDYAMTQAEIENLASVTHGFVGADLACLVGKAQTLCQQRRSEVTTSINMATMNAALITVKPSAMREVLIETPNVRWTDIGGQADLKLKLVQSIEWPLKKPELFEKFGITPPKGLLMFGPPGCSKTLIAKAMATESQLNFLSFKGSDLFSMWVGESEKAVRDLFRKAKQVAPSIVFFDEIDAIGGERATDGGGQGTSVKERVLAQILTELDGVNVLNNVIIIAATNRPDLIDKALMRPGRLDRIVYVRLPDEETRREIFAIKLNRMPVADDVSLEWLVQATTGYSGAEITAICQEAALKALEQSFDAQHIENQHFQHALNVVRPRTCKKLLTLYDEFVSQF
jgi:AAA family ATPase